MNNSFIERTLLDINDALEQSLFAESISRKKGLLQAFDPRLKLVVLLILLITIGAVQSWQVVFIALLFSLVFVILSRIPLIGFIKRVLLVIFLFTGVVAIPALFLTQGPVEYILPWGIEITRTGLHSAVMLILRVSTSISLASVMIFTTPWNDILKAFGVMRLPDVVILIFSMTYRYIHLLLHEAADMFLSHKSRILRKLDRQKQRELLGGTTGVLLEKSLHMSEEVYLAMQSRGFHHYPRTLNQFKMHWWDWFAGAFALAFCLTVIIIGL